MEMFLTILGKFGLPVAAAVVMGFFIFLVIKYILDSVVGQVSGMHGIIMSLENRVKNMNNDMIKLDIQISDALNLDKMKKELVEPMEKKTQGEINAKIFAGGLSGIDSDRLRQHGKRC
jgi:hypothetical protein